MALPVETVHHMVDLAALGGLGTCLRGPADLPSTHRWLLAAAWAQRAVCSRRLAWGLGALRSAACAVLVDAGFGNRGEVHSWVVLRVPAHGSR